MASLLDRRLRPLLLAALASSACTTPSQFLSPDQAGGPQGILGGTLAYSGPLPCTEGGHIVGAAVLLAFDARLLPPPDGLGTTAVSLAAVAGDTLFGGMVDRLTFNEDGSRWCPASTTPPVTTSADWTLGPLPGGVYEVRGFYDLGGQFDPVFSITKLPHKGDIAGGAIENVSAVLMGAAPIYRRITLGTPTDAGDGSYEIPPQGSNIDGVAVTLGLPLAQGLPIFYSSEVHYSPNVCKDGMVSTSTTTPSTDPNHVTMASDYTLPTFTQMDPTNTETSILRIGLTAGVAPADVAAAAAPPFNLPVKPADPFSFSWQDVNGDGMLDLTHDHVAASAIVPSLFPLSIFTKLKSPDDNLTTQSAPAVVIQGLTIYKSLLSTSAWAFSPPANNLQTAQEVIVGVTPAVICLDPTDFSGAAKAKLVITHLTDCTGNKILMDEPGTLMALTKQFGRPVELVPGCLPQGRYAMNLVYGSGQAWTVPNEAGNCQVGETQQGSMCVASGPAGATRALLPSQNVVLTIGSPDDPSYCKANPTPTECCPAGVDAATGACK